jgi:hypothetical protein
MPGPEAAALPGISSDEVVALVGRLDDGTIASILDTGATYAEIEQALAALSADEVLQEEPLSAAAEAVYDILDGDPSFAPADPVDR